MVIILHIELIKKEFYYKNIKELCANGGNLGVILFFVLSGFLITFLLLSEESFSGTISLRNFYIRRILRIWPLYFIVVLSCLFILPHISFLYEPQYTSSYLHNRYLIVFFYVFLLANFLTGFDSHVNFARPTWSVSVEEQFYLIWPILIKFSKNKKKAIINVIIIYWIVRFILEFLVSEHFSFLSVSFNDRVYALLRIIQYTPFDCLSIGALAAMALFNKSYHLKWIFSRKTQIAVFVALPVLIYLFSLRTIFKLSFMEIEITNEMYSVLFAIAILNMAANPNRIFSLERFKILRYLGKISYGLYLYHWVTIVLVINILKRYYVPQNYNEFAFNCLLYSGSIGLTVLISSGSYFFIEYRFLKLKHRFSRIISGDMV